MKVPRCIDPEKIIPISRYSTEAFQTGSWANRRPVHREKISPCRVACPAGNNITQAMLMASQGDFDRALEAFLEENPLPGVCGRVCYHPCQADCNRGKWDGEVSIRALERAASEIGEAEPRMLTDSGKDHPVAVLGAGPAGLSAAYHLARMGHEVTLVEAGESLGGLLREGIPLYRLPEEVLERDMKRILSLGIRCRTGMRMDAGGIAELKEDNEALFIATGASMGLSLEVEGTGLEGVVPGIQFLKDVRGAGVGNVQGKVVVIGGGNVAIDAAMTASRLGADRVDLVSLEGEEEMPAHAREMEDAREEGIFFHHGWGPGRITGRGGRVSGVEFVKCVSLFDGTGKFNPSYDVSRTFSMEAHMVIVAIGQAPDIPFLKENGLFEYMEGHLAVDARTMETSVPGIFAGGDLVVTGGSVAGAIASGKLAALAIHMRSQGREVDETMARLRLGSGTSFSMNALFHEREGWDPGKVVMFEDLEPMFLDVRKPIESPRLTPESRRGNFREIDLSMNRDEAVRAAERCFFCGTCTECDRCFIYCPEISIIRPDEDHAAYRVDEAHCKGCAVCNSVCTRGVMSMSEGK